MQYLGCGVHAGAQDGEHHRLVRVEEGDRVVRRVRGHGGHVSPGQLPAPHVRHVARLQAQPRRVPPRVGLQHGRHLCLGGLAQPGPEAGVRGHDEVPAPPQLLHQGPRVAQDDVAVTICSGSRAWDFYRQIFCPFHDMH